MRLHLKLLAASLVFISHPAFAAWSKFVDPLGNFSFEAQAKVTPTKDQTVSPLGKVIPSVNYVIGEGPAGMGVMGLMGVIDATNSQISKASSNPQFLDFASKLLQKGIGATVESVSMSTEILDGQEGRRLEFILPGNIDCTYRIFFVRGHLLIAFSGYGPGANVALMGDAARFHKSFHLSVR
jgi:hypothetical protein